MSQDSNYIDPKHNAYVLNKLPATQHESVIFGRFSTAKELLHYIKETVSETGYKNLIEDLRANIESEEDE